jgi:signal transduction histidine kinase
VAVPVTRRVNILVVDDRDENLMALEAVLDDPAYRVVRARSGREALKEVLEQDFALILLDVVMPGVDGYETASLIRERPRSRQTPIIFLTANDFGANYVFRGYAAGAVDYLVKPVAADVLRSKVAVFVELFNRQLALKRAHEELEDRIAERTRELAQAVQGEQAARLEAERANRVKDEFLATLSHELRTPLNAIMGWAHVLSQSATDRDTVQRATAVIRQNAAAQAQLIDDILDVSRVVGGRLVLDTAVVTLKTVIEDAVNALGPAAAAKAIHVECLLDDHLNVIGDRDRLQQIVWNLVSNALKFTPKGGAVRVRLRAVGDDVEIEVADTGIGIPADFLPFVFDRFRQADSSMSRRHSGLGLGMAIVRHLVELHGGTVAVASQGEGQGTTFILRLPRHTGELAAELRSPRREMPDTAQQALDQLHGIHVLIVEDDADSRNVLAVLLQRLGALVEAVGSAAEAYDRIARCRPDVLVSDIGMPDEDGYTFIRHVRQRNAGARRLPAIALTAYARKQDADTALTAGYDHHLAKPVMPADLVKAIKEVTGRQAPIA